VEYAVREIVEESGQRLVDVCMLAAFVSVWPGELRPAIEAAGFVRVPRGGFARAGLDRPAEDAASDCIADRFEIAGHGSPLRARIVGHPRAC
jgi:hypothetical protein